MNTETMNTETPQSGLINRAAANFYSYSSQRQVQVYPLFAFGVDVCIGGRSGRICLPASASVEKIRLYGNRMTQSSTLLLNLIVTNDDDAETTDAFVTYLPQMRKKTC